MMAVNVGIEKATTLLDLPLKDGTTQKRLDFKLWINKETIFEHSLTDGSRLLDERIEKLQAYGSITIKVEGFEGEEPSSVWKDYVSCAALAEADGISWEGAPRKRILL